MKISYYSDTDTMYIDLKDIPGAHTRALVQDVMFDVDENGVPVGIEIEHASKKIDKPKEVVLEIDDEVEQAPGYGINEIDVFRGLADMLSMCTRDGKVNLENIETRWAFYSELSEVAKTSTLGEVVEDYISDVGYFIWVLRGE